MSDATNELRIGSLEHDMKNVKHCLYGIDGRIGLSQMVNVIWRTHVFWPACTLSALGGAALTVAVTYVIKHI